MGSTHGIGVKRNDYHRRNRRRNISMHKHSHGHNVGIGHLERIANTKIEIPHLERDELVARACKSWNSRARSLGLQEITPISQKKKVEIACLNYLRHHLTDYNKLLRGQGYENEVFKLVSEKILTAIAAAYPWLAEECKSQLTQRTDRLDLLLEKGIRVIKRHQRLTSLHVEEFNAKQEEPPDTELSESDEVAYFHEALSSMDSSRFMYLPPFLKRDEIKERRFGDPFTMNDRWWEWEAERSLNSTVGRPQNWREK